MKTIYVCRICGARYPTMIDALLCTLAHPADRGPVPVPELVLESETGRE